MEAVACKSTIVTENLFVEDLTVGAPGLHCGVLVAADQTRIPGDIDTQDSSEFACGFVVSHDMLPAVTQAEYRAPPCVGRPGRGRHSLETY